MGGSRVPDLVGHWVGTVGQPGGGFGQCQRGALSVSEVRSLPPGGNRKEPLVADTGFLGAQRSRVNASAAAVDLAGPQVDQFQGLAWDPALVDGFVQGLN